MLFLERNFAKAGKMGEVDLNLVGVTVKRGFWIFFSKLLSKLRWLEKTYVTTKKAPSMVLLYIQMYLLLKINFDVMFRIVADEELHQPPASNY